MRLFIQLILFFLTTNLCAQELKILETSVGESLDFSDEIQKKWEKGNQLFYDLENEKRNWDNLSIEEKKLLEEFDETYESIWDVEGAGCSWYCGAGNYVVTTSSELISNGKFNYNTKNITDFSYQTAWVEGSEDYGIGEFINFSFSPTHPRITSIIFVNGYVKSKKVWKENSRVHKLKMYVDDKPYSIIELKDVYAKQFVNLEKPLGNNPFENIEEDENWNIKFEILSVYKGDKYDDTAITEIYFDGIDVHCLGKGTLITMGDKTLKRIENLRVGDEILSFNKKTKKYETSIIKELAGQFHDNLVCIEFSDGTEVICTKDHPFLNENLEWVSISPDKTSNSYEIENVGKLELGSKIKKRNAQVTVTGISTLFEGQMTYTIVDLNRNNTFIANGILTGVERLREVDVTQNN